MAKTKEITTVRLHFTKESFIEWSNVKDCEWQDSTTLNFTDKDGQEMEICATAQAIIITTREEVVSF